MNANAAKHMLISIVRIVGTILCIGLALVTPLGALGFAFSGFYDINSTIYLFSIPPALFGLLYTVLRTYPAAHRLQDLDILLLGFLSTALSLVPLLNIFWILYVRSHIGRKEAVARS